MTASFDDQAAAQIDARAHNYQVCATAQSANERPESMGASQSAGLAASVLDQQTDFADASTSNLSDEMLSKINAFNENFGNTSPFLQDLPDPLVKQPFDSAIPDGVVATTGAVAASEVAAENAASAKETVMSAQAADAVFATAKGAGASEDTAFSNNTLERAPAFERAAVWARWDERARNSAASELAARSTEEIVVAPRTLAASFSDDQLRRYIAGSFVDGEWEVVSIPDDVAGTDVPLLAIRKGDINALVACYSSQSKASLEMMRHIDSPSSYAEFNGVVIVGVGDIDEETCDFVLKAGFTLWQVDDLLDFL